MARKVKNYIIEKDKSNCGTIQALLEAFGTNSNMFDLSGKTLLINMDGNCSWSITMDEHNIINFKGLGSFLPQYDENERLNLINQANNGQGICRYSFLGENTLGISYSLVCKNGLPTKLLLDTWEKILEEQQSFQFWLERMTFERGHQLTQQHLDQEEMSKESRTHGLEHESGLRAHRNFMLGCMFGGAIGDALGAPVELLSREEILKAYKPKGIAHFEKAYGGIAKITDDTQMTLFTLEALIRCKMRSYDHGMVNPADMFFYAYLRWAKTQGLAVKNFENYITSEGFYGWLFTHQELHNRRGPGNSCISALSDASRRGTIENRINNSKGCGGVMRAAPAGFFDEYPGAFELGCKLAAITHGHPTGFLSAGFFAEMIAQLRRGNSLLEAIFMANLELKKFDDSQEVSDAVWKAVDFASSSEEPHLQIAKLGQGWVAEEALAISIYCAIKAEDFRDGVLMAVNHSGDSDSTGAMTGSILGAIYGYEGIFKPWRDLIELGEVMVELVDDALNIFEDGRKWREYLRKYPPF